jgi:hypothetical protein
MKMILGAVTEQGLCYISSLLYSLDLLGIFRPVTENYDGAGLEAVAPHQTF